MRNIVLAVVLAAPFLIVSPTTHAAEAEAKAEIRLAIDGVAVASDVKPEIRNDRTMVPLRIIGENLGATVHWSNSEVTLTKGEVNVTLHVNSSTAVKNGEQIHLDAKPYMKNDRILVPLRLIAESFGSTVNYSDSTVAIDTPPVVIDGVQAKAVQYEYRMTMGGVVQHIHGNAYIEAMYNIFAEHNGEQAEAPISGSWRIDMDTPGSYQQIGQYAFLDDQGHTIAQYGIYSLNRYFPAEMLSEYPLLLLYDAAKDQWYSFGEIANQSIHSLFDAAYTNGFVTIISNTVV